MEPDGQQQPCNEVGMCCMCHLPFDAGMLSSGSACCSQASLLCLTWGWWLELQGLKWPLLYAEVSFRWFQSTCRQGSMLASQSSPYSVLSALV